MLSVWVAEANDQMSPMTAPLSTVVLLLIAVTWIVALLVAYWVIRLAVRHALRDAAALPEAAGQPARASQGQ